jgi:peptidoglycan/LPS O-acetylase OafA/YrhL
MESFHRGAPEVNGAIRRAAVLAFLLLVLPGHLCPAEPAAADLTVGNQGLRDGALHVLAGCAAALLSAAVAYPLIEADTRQNSSLLVAGIGLSGALLAGLSKEALDLCGFGDPSWLDLLLTAAGGLAASSLVYGLSFSQPYERLESLGIPCLFGAFALILSLPVGEALFRRAIPSSESRS